MAWLTENWLFLLLLLGVMAFMMRGGMGMGCGHGGHGSHGRHRRQDEAPPVDPVSREAVAPDSTIVATHRGRLYRFVSRENRDRFEADPERYAGALPPQDGAAHRHRRHGGC